MATDLEQLAYGRASDAAARADAELRLRALQEAEAARLEEERLEAEAVEQAARLAQWHSRLDSRLLQGAARSRESRPALTVLAAGLSLVFLLSAAWGYATQLRGSLTVFDRPMSSRDESAPDWVFGTLAPVDDTVAVRWIGTNSRYNLYGVLGADGDVCVAIVEPGVGGTSACATAADFASDGVRIEGDIAGRPYAVEWGPRGQPRWENPSVLSS